MGYAEDVLGFVVFAIIILFAVGGILMNVGMKSERFKSLFVRLSPWIGLVALILFSVQTRLHEKQTMLREKKSEEMGRQLGEMSGQLRTIRAQLSGGIKVETGSTETERGRGIDTASIDRVYPFLRYAFLLENYDGSTSKAGNENRLILKSSPPIRIHFKNYSEVNPAVFDFGVANLNGKAPIDNVMFSVTFLGERGTVKSEGSWGIDMPNEQYSFNFKSINAQSGLNGDGMLRVLFPHPGNYTIRLAINARGLGETTRDLPVIVE